MTAQVTGGTPSAGVFYDSSYDRTFFAPGSNCAGTPGAETTFAENLDYNLNDVTGGGTLGDPLSQISPANLPMTLDAHGNCVVVYPHLFSRVNTLFEVLKAAGMHTAWSDKHPAYEILSCPSGKGIEDLFTPEINSQDPRPGAPAGTDNTASFSAVRDYDQLKVTAVLNEIAAESSTGTFVGHVPAIFGMNIQAVSVGQKLTTAGFGDDPALAGGYTDAAGTPGNALTLQLQFIDDSIAAMVAALKQYNLDQDTAIIISAKHGQSPIDRSKLDRIKDTYSTVLANDGYGFNIAADASLTWLDPSKRTAATLQSARADLQAKALAAGGYRIVAPDQRGYGQTDCPHDLNSYDMTHLVGDVVGLMGALDSRSAILVGQDWGSPVVYNTALMRPDLVRGVVMMCSPRSMRGTVPPAAALKLMAEEKGLIFYQTYLAEPEATTEIMRDLRRFLLGIFYSTSGACPDDKQWRWAWKTSESFSDTYTVPATLPPFLSQQALDYYVAEYTRTGIQPANNWYAAIDQGWANTSFLDGAIVQQPAVFAGGDRDPSTKTVFGIDRQGPALRGLKTSFREMREIIMLPGVGHTPPEERPEEVNALVLKFLKEISS
jgi:epoxide hydrolase A/B